jgi:DNA polymerase III delta prime subunit
MIKSNSLWFEKYRPTILENYIGNSHMKEKFAQYISTGYVPHLLLVGPAGTGKAQPLDSKVLTINGWKCMGDLKKYERIITPSGRTAKIIDIFPQGTKNVVEISFKDGRKVRCCKEHLWQVYEVKNHNKGTVKIVSTSEMIQNFDTLKYQVNLTEPIEFSPNEYFIDPYVIGVLLGDGYIPDGRGVPSLSTKDSYILDKLKGKLEDFKFTKYNAYDYRIQHNSTSLIQGRKNEYMNPLKKELFKLGILGKKSYEKRVPSDYLYGSIEQRLELIRGLMDTDGTVDKTGSISFCTTSELLAKDVQQIIWSLGGIAKITTKQSYYTYKGIKKKGRLAYIIRIRYKDGRVLFSIPRKLERISTDYQYKNCLRNTIVSIIDIGEDECQCIMIDDPEHLYLTDGFVPTHNTTAAKILQNSIECDRMILNASDENNIDTVRGKIRTFASTRGWAPMKIMVLDEFDGFTQAGQRALRNLMETFSDTTRFILTANYIERVEETIISRTQQFKVIPPSVKDTAIHVAGILKKEGVTFKLADLKLIIDAHFPDIRKIINETELAVIDGELRVNHKEIIESDVKLKIVDAFKNKKSVLDVRQLVADSQMRDFAEMYQLLYTRILEYATPEQLPPVILALNEGQYRENSVVDREINFMSTVVQILEAIS